MLSEANLKEIEDAHWTFIVGGKLPDIPYAINEWMRNNPGAEPADGQVLTQPLIMGTKADTRRRTAYYQYRQDRARRTCMASTPRSPKPRRPWPARCR